MTPEPTEALLAAERAIGAGAALLRQGRAHVGALIGKGDRDFAAAVDLRIEETSLESSITRCATRAISRLWVTTSTAVF